MPEAPMTTAIPRRTALRVIAMSVVRTVTGLILITIGMLLVPDTIGTRSTLAMAVIVLIGLTAWVLYMRWAVVGIRRARYPRVRSAETLIVSIWLFVSVFASFYVTIGARDPMAFTEPLDHFTAAYFALTILATVGFGDITPTNTLARSVTMVQMSLDLFIIGVAVKVLTGSANRAVQERATSVSGPSDSRPSDNGPRGDGMSEHGGQ